MELPVGLLSLAFGGSANGTLIDVRPCTVAANPDPTRWLTLVLPGGVIGRSVIVESAGTCFFSTEPVFLIVDFFGSIGTVASPTGLQFVPGDAVLYDGPVAASSSTTVLLGTLPVGAGGVVLRLDGRSVDQGFIGRCGSGLSYAQTASFPDGIVPPSETIAYVQLAPTDTSVCLSSFAAADLKVSLVGWLSSEGPDATRLPPYLWSTASGVRSPGMVAVPPVRVLDTRDGTGTDIAEPLPGGATQILDLTDHISDLSVAVVLNVTVTGPAAPGFVTVYPCDEGRPTASNLNFTKDQTVPNLVTVPLAADGTVCLYSDATTDLIADFAGTYEWGGGEGSNPIAPTRLMDTRDGTGVAKAGKLPGGVVTRLQVAGPGRAVPTGATAITMNVTVNDPTQPGFLTVYPCDTAPPIVSNLNFTAHQTVANLVTVKLAADGSVCILPQWDTHVIVDAATWFGAGSEGFWPMTPTRVLDTRERLGVPSPGRLAAGGVLTLQVGSELPLPGSAVLLNVTATGTQNDGFVTAYPCDQARPTASNLNYVAGQTVPNLVSVKMSATGTVCLYSQSSTHLIADLGGYITPVRARFWTNALSS